MVFTFSVEQKSHLLKLVAGWGWAIKKSLDILEVQGWEIVEKCTDSLNGTVAF